MGREELRTLEIMLRIYERPLLPGRPLLLGRPLSVREPKYTRLLEPHLFSPNLPRGACQEVRGAGAHEFGKEIVGEARGMRALSQRKAEPVGWRLPWATSKQTTYITGTAESLFTEKKVEQDESFTTPDESFASGEEGHLADLSKYCCILDASPRAASSPGPGPLSTARNVPPC